MVGRSNGWAHSLSIDTLMKLIFPVFRMQGDRVIGFWVVMRTGMQGNGVADAAERGSENDRQKHLLHENGVSKGGSCADRAGWGWSRTEDQGRSAERLSKQDSDRLFDLVIPIRIELERHIGAAAIRRKDKQDLLASLPQVLQSYTAFTVLRAYPFRVAINHIITTEAATRCSIHLTSEELLGLWREVR